MEDALHSNHDTALSSRGLGRNIFQVFWQRRGLILFGTILGVGLGLFTYLQRQPVYRSSAQVLVVKKQTTNALPVAGGDPRMAVMEDYVATQLIVIRSPIVIRMAAEKRNLGSLKSLQGRDPVTSIQAGLIAAREVAKDSSAMSNNNVVNLLYSGSDPGDGEQILNAIIESYKDFLDRTYQNTSEESVRLIHEAANTLNSKVEQKEEEYRQFRKASPLLILGENGVSVHQSKILEYQKKESETREQLVAIEKRNRAIEMAVEEDQTSDFILALAERRYEKGITSQVREQKANATALETSLKPLFEKEADLLLFYGKDHPDVVRVQKMIEMTKEYHNRLAKIAQEENEGSTKKELVQNALEALQVEERLARGKYELFQKFLADEIKEARNLDTWYSRDQGFRDDIKRTREVLATTMKRLEEINLVRGYGGVEAKVLAQPAPGGKVSPVFWQFLIISALMGLIGSSAVAYVLDLFDKSFRTPEEIRKRLGLSIIGHVPYVPAAVEPVKMIDAAGNPVELDPGLIALHQPISPASEGFRGIRTALYFSMHSQRHQVIQVTSPNMGDGKTTLITNLAISIAQSGRKVLVVDADLRRPRVHRAFGLASKIGLAEVIAGTAALDEAIQITVVPNLSVLPCGRRPLNPSELLTLPQFEDVIDDLRSAFDYVLIDTPPLLAVSDPCIVATRMDGLVLAIRLSKNGRPAAERAGDILAALKVNMIGVVVNGVGKHGSMSGYGYEHYRYADEYTASYTTAEDTDTEAGGEAPKTLVTMPSSATEHESPLPKGFREPSTNGHAKHALPGE